MKTKFKKGDTIKDTGYNVKGVVGNVEATIGSLVIKLDEEILIDGLFVNVYCCRTSAKFLFHSRRILTEKTLDIFKQKRWATD
jgi:hypothetical protein